MPYDNPILLPTVAPQAGLNTVILTGGASVIVFPVGVYGGYIQNPVLGTDQGLVTPEDLFINPINPAPLQGLGTTARKQPGGTWTVPFPKSTLAVWVNAASSGHQFTAVYWLGP
jgi:hypothetical protein